MPVPTHQLPDGEIPVAGAGTWNLRAGVLQTSVETALDIGVRHFDTAEGYRNEETLGAVLGDAPVDREDLFITSKVLPKHLTYDALVAACERSLDRLDLDYLDLYLIHWPNPTISLRESLHAMATVSDRGLVRNVGVSNFTPYQLSCAHHISDVPIAVNQVEFHPWSPRVDLREYCEGTETVLEAAAPLARTAVLEDETISDLATDYDKSPAQIALRWAIQHDVVVLPKSSSPRHVRENFDLFEWSLDPADMRRIDEIETRRRVYDTPAYDWTQDDYGVKP